MKKRIPLLVIHGPNLNLLGEREPEIYGKMTFIELNRKLRTHAENAGATLKIRQFNSEGDIIDCLHAERRRVKGVVINPAGYTHYSISIRDAIAAIGIPCIEVHLTDLSKREPFRKISVIAPVCIQQISGLGLRSYYQGLDALLKELRG